MSANGWEEWSKYVLLELERINRVVDQNTKTLNKIDRRLTIIETKAIVFACLASAALTIIVNLIVFSLRG